MIFGILWPIIGDIRNFCTSMIVSETLYYYVRGHTSPLPSLPLSDIVGPTIQVETTSSCNGNPILVSHPL